MLDSYPPDLRDFVIQKIADGSFRTADEFAVEAASLYRELETRQRELRVQVADGLKQLEGADYYEFESAADLDSFFGNIKSRGRDSLQSSASEQ